MPFSEELQQRMHPIIMTRPGVTEKHMFGGIAFTVHGNMCCGIWKDLLVIRLSKEEGEEALKEPHTRPMDITGKPMRGWIFVEVDGYKKDKDLLAWIERAYAFASGLPPKKK